MSGYMRGVHVELCLDRSAFLDQGHEKVEAIARKILEFESVGSAPEKILADSYLRSVVQDIVIQDRGGEPVAHYSLLFSDVGFLIHTYYLNNDGGYGKNCIEIEDGSSSQL
mmetsp:Transcript_15390/g.31196  ORF Transcript_15390/g.31196 Transcript_15390/m.31196 type:complete len:111 (-) Transcript_15390:111-443(-)